jgi:hypothetical protein
LIKTLIQFELYVIILSHFKLIKTLKFIEIFLKKSINLLKIVYTIIDVLNNFKEKFKNKKIKTSKEMLSWK